MTRATNETTERPILFSGPMVRAILDGTKTQTRRPLRYRGGPIHDTRPKNGWVYSSLWKVWQFIVGSDVHGYYDVRCPFGDPGERLWVRETWGLCAPFDFTDFHRESVRGWTKADILEQWNVEYRADWGDGNQESCFWRPAIHMPRWASRIELKLRRVRVERVSAITEADARAEGFNSRADFLTAFASIYGETDDWVWVLDFERVKS